MSFAFVDSCPYGSQCIPNSEYCDGTVDNDGCCGDKKCCTPPPCKGNQIHRTVMHL